MREGDVLESRFRLDAVAGSGAMGLVFRATDLARGASVAVKVLRQAEPTDVARFAREAEVLVALQHPNVVRYVAHGRTSANEPFLVMEWLEGETLKDRLARGPLSTLEAFDVGLALVSALAGAHGRGVIHRDVKPANVILVGGSARTVKLLDFGVAALRRQQTLTEAGAMIGTPAYMSPEQARGEEVDARSDVFSLGALLFHCLAGERPFQGDDVLSIVLRIVSERAPALAPRAPSAPVPLTQLVDAMLEPAADRRPKIALIASELARLRATHDPTLTVSHVVPVLAKATLVQAGGAASATSGPVATVTHLHVGGYATPPPVAGAYAAPAARPTTAPAWRRWLVIGLAVNLVAGIIVAAVLLLPSGRKKDTSSTSSPSPSESARASTPPSLVASSEPAAPSASSAASSPCAAKKFDLCEPLPFDLGAVDPDAFVALCLSVVRRVAGTSELALAAFGLRGDRIDTKDGKAMCVFDRNGDPDLVVTAVHGYLVVSKMEDRPQAKQLVSASDPRCSFGAAYAKAHALGARPTTADLSFFAGFFVWKFKDGAGAEVTLSAKTCEKQGPATPATPAAPERKPKIGVF